MAKKRAAGQSRDRGKKEKKGESGSNGALGFEHILWAAADKLRGHMDASESKHDFMLANPPFNVADWSGERLRDDKRSLYGPPPARCSHCSFASV